MNLFVLGPLAIGLILTLLRMVIPSGSSAASANYRYDPVIASMILVMSLILLSLPMWLPYAQPGKDNEIVYAGAGSIAAVGFIGCVWLFSFRVIVTEQFIEYGAVMRKRLCFTKIRRIKVGGSDVKGSIAVYPDRGLRIVFTCTLQNYPALKLDILNRVPPTVRIEYW
ncbi:hypothetical protein [Burkholderia sp. MSHR3999]|uniref:hypothetical protein n=1 Tax=Burkholderia sp. MSHR3999 TaxID=1542965 RepID=UPI0012E0838A|nr:hypothetical protein [Burkholderia sp. MSHR3999]